MGNLWGEFFSFLAFLCVCFVEILILMLIRCIATADGQGHLGPAYRVKCSEAIGGFIKRSVNASDVEGRYSLMLRLESWRMSFRCLSGNSKDV